MLLLFFLMQPVKIIDPHLVSSFFDGFKRAYLHTTLELENKSSWVADCSLNLQVTTEVEGNICLVEHQQTYYISVPPGKVIQHTIPPVSASIIFCMFCCLIIILSHSLLLSSTFSAFISCFLTNHTRYKKLNLMSTTNHLMKYQFHHNLNWWWEMCWVICIRWRGITHISYLGSSEW